ncbi:hypothetical protein SDC9_152527 [bioreactor metagenome]|uniref:Uncharacterized protein n=1 Tax=bioreactor metagenome TaxID=1076179 RepID=A0A645ETV6_9ZZZZ
MAEIKIMGPGAFRGFERANLRGPAALLALGRGADTPAEMVLFHWAGDQFVEIGIENADARARKPVQIFQQCICIFCVNQKLHSPAP